MRCLPTAVLSLTLLVAAAHPGQAQLGGLKKKLTDKVTGKKPDTTVVAGGTGTRAKCDQSAIVITADVVDRYLKGLAASEAELRRIAKEPGPAGAYYNAYFRRQAVERRKEAFDLRRGNDWERYKVIYPRMAKGDQAAMREIQALTDSLQPGRVQIPELSWETQQQNNQRLDSVAMKAAGFSACDWGGTGLGERMPTIVRELINNPNGKGAGTPQEVAAVKARLPELTAAMGYSGGGRHEYTEAEKAHIQEEDEKLARSAALTGDPYTDCVTNYQQEFYKKHQAELDKASQAKDMAAVQRLTMQLSQESAKECGKYSKNKDKDADDDD